MLEKVNAYFKNGNYFPFLRKLRHNVLSSPGYCSVNILSQEIQIAYLLTISGKPEIQFCKSFPFVNFDEIETVLNDVVKEYNLENTTCFWVLAEEHYQATVMEDLPVAAAEFQTAIRWKIQDSLSYPVADVVIDHFPLPEQKAGGANKMIMLVTSRLSYLTSLAKKFKNAGLKLVVIDIPELALRNVNALFENDEKSTALIHLEDKHSELLLTQRGQLYFKRRLEFGLDQIASLDSGDSEAINPRLDKLSLEIQRSFDYYQSQWRHPVPARIFLTSHKGSIEKMSAYLTQRLSLNVQPLDILTAIASKQSLSLEEQGRFLVVLGEVFREVTNYAETTD